jgi:signal transduction histidine kinase
MGDVRPLRLRLADLVAGAAFEVGAFRVMYRRNRLIVAASVGVLAPSLGAMWLEHRARVIPVLLLLAALIPLHAWTTPRASWAQMALVDGILYTAMLVSVELPELIGMVIMAQLLIGVLFVRGAVAIRLALVLAVVGLIGFTASLGLHFQVYTSVQRVILYLLISILSIIPALSALLEVGRTIRANADEAERLSAEKDELLIAKDRFVASVSHELRTPLTAVVGLARTLAEGGVRVGEKERQELLDLIADESEQVAALVDDLLVIARLQSNSLSVQPEILDMRPLVEDAVGAWPRPVNITGQFVPVWGDLIRVRQILRNLVSNAARYGGSTLAVVVGQRAGLFTVEVRDDGDGVSAGMIEAIFDPYGRAHERPGRTDSVGLGLTVTRELATLMGGDVRYFRDGHWTVFELELPTEAGSVALAPVLETETSLSSDGIRGLPMATDVQPA